MFKYDMILLRCIIWRYRVTHDIYAIVCYIVNKIIDLHYIQITSHQNYFFSFYINNNIYIFF